MNWLNKVSVFDDIYLVLISIATLVFLFRYKALPYNLRILPLFTTIHFLTEFLSLYIHYSLKQDNYLVYHLFAYSSYVALSLFFYRTFRASSLKKAVLILIPIYFSLSLLYTLLWEPITVYNSLAFMTEHFLMIIWCFAFYRAILDYSEPYRPEKDRSFWIITGLLFYFVGNFFILSSYNYIWKHRPDILSNMYYAGYVFDYLLYITIILTGLIKFPADKYD
jgi:hypothetical protein